MGLPKGCQCYLGPFGAKVLFITSLIVTLTTLHNLVVKPALWRLLLPPAKLQLEHDETIYAMDEQKMHSIRSSTNHSKAASFELVIVTAASSNYYPQLVNLIGSVHLWEAGLPVVVYDLGLNPPQLRELSCLGKVTVKPFPFKKQYSSSSPSDFRSRLLDLQTGAFKPFVISDALVSHPKLVFMDAGTELWSTLDHVVETLKADGFFFVRKPLVGSEDAGSGRATGGVEDAKRNSMGPITDSIQGYVRHSTGAEKVLQRIVQCERYSNCSLIETPAAASEGLLPSFNSFSLRSKPIRPSSFSKVLSQSRLPVKGKLYDFETVKHQKDLKLLFSRRSHCPKPHIRLLNYGQCPVNFSFDGKELHERRRDALDGDVEGTSLKDQTTLEKDQTTLGKDLDNHQGVTNTIDSSSKEGLHVANPKVISGFESLKNDAVNAADAQSHFPPGSFAFNRGVTERRVIPCGAIMLGDTHIDTQTLFKFAFIAEAVVVSVLICALMRRYIIKNRHIVIREDHNAWAKLM